MKAFPVMRPLSPLPPVRVPGRSSACTRRDHAAPHLVALQALEQRLEIALAKALIALALDDLEEDRADHVLGENLQQQAAARLRRAVDQYAALAHGLDIVAMAGQALFDHVVIAGGRVLEPDAVGAQGVDRGEDVIGGKGDMLDALASIGAQELLDLAMLVPALLERYADLAVGRRHRLGDQPGRLPRY